MIGYCGLGTGMADLQRTILNKKVLLGPFSMLLITPNAKTTPVPQTDLD